jgi:peptidoglycan/xylan/chitin deacetylase (PgdA/CDA1 family)
LAAGCKQQPDHRIADPHGAVIRGDTTARHLALVFTGDEFADGALHILQMLGQRSIKASFFLTGNFYRNPDFSEAIVALASDGHYLGAHSDRHLLYCTWENRDSLLVTREQFVRDVLDNYAEMRRFGITREDARYFLPPYEWYNARIARWTAEIGLTLVNYTPGTRSHADYTTPDMRNYAPSDEILKSIFKHESGSASGLNGFLLLVHIGAAPERTDKLYHHLDAILDTLIARGYGFRRIDELLDEHRLSAARSQVPAAGDAFSNFE